jgi:hypothetical protein
MTITKEENLTAVRAASASLFPDLSPAQFNAFISKVNDTKET